MRKTTLITICIFTTLLFSCEENKETSSFDRKPILENLQTNIIIPTYQQFIKKAKDLDTAITSFNEEPTIAHLTAVRNQWKEVALAWKSAELFNFGPIKNGLITNKIDYWPTDTSGIEKSIENYDSSADYLVSQGSNKKGIPAIEYLVFHGAENDIIASFQEQKRKDYLNLLAQDLIHNIEQVHFEWVDSYGINFASKTGNKAKDGLTLISNQMIAVIEEVKSMKIGEPAGKKGIREVQTNKVESPYAQFSIQMAAQNIQTVQRVFNGGDGVGMDDYLVSLNIKDEEGQILSEIVNKQFSDIADTFGSVNGSLQQALIDQPAILDELYLQLIDLYILIHNDMMSQLDLLTVYTDSDGD